MSQCQTIVNSQCDKRNHRSVLSKWLLSATESSDSLEVARAMPRVLSTSLSFGCFTCLLQRPRQTEDESFGVPSRSSVFSFQEQVEARRLVEASSVLFSPCLKSWGFVVKLSCQGFQPLSNEPTLRSACPLSPPVLTVPAPKCNYSHAVRTLGSYRLTTKP